MIMHKVFVFSLSAILQFLYLFVIKYRKNVCVGAVVVVEGEQTIRKCYSEFVTRVVFKQKLNAIQLSVSLEYAKRIPYY